MEFKQSWNTFANLVVAMIAITIFPLAYVIYLLISTYSPLPKYPEVSYFLMLGGFSISMALYFYGLMYACITLWLKYALKHHTKNQILQGIEAKFTTKSALYKWFQQSLKNT
jgi:hypothetical protein